MRITLVAAVVGSIAFPTLDAQSRIADEGSFTISVSGRTAGRESFRITATTRGEVTEYLARGEITYGDRRVTPELRTGADGGIVDYRVTTRSGATAESWEGVVAAGRLNAKIASGSSSSHREYIVPAGSVVLDDDVMHHSWFLARRAEDARVPIVRPSRSGVQAVATITRVGQETVQVGNHEVATTHLRATVAGGEVREFWVDRSGRLMKVAIPARNIIAIRDDPPPA